MWTPKRTLMITLSALSLVSLSAAAASAAAPDVPALTVSAMPDAAERADAAEKVLVTAFEAALADDFKAYEALLHSSAKDGKKAEMEFKRFARQATWYLSGKDASSFEVAKTQDLGSAKRIYLKDREHPTRSTANVRMEKDGSAWKIAQNAL